MIWCNSNPLIMSLLRRHLTPKLCLALETCGHTPQSSVPTDIFLHYNAIGLQNTVAVANFSDLVIGYIVLIGTS